MLGEDSAERLQARLLVHGVIELRLAGERAERALRDSHDLAVGLRSAGVSWATIGEALGITRQAAQQRFGTK